MITVWAWSRVRIPGCEYQVDGTFQDNPVKGCPNGSLWTLPWEVRAYVFVVLIGILGIFKSLPSVNLLYLISISILIVSSFYPDLNVYDNPGVPYMLGAFVIGMFFSSNKDRASMRVAAVFLFFVGLFLLCCDYHLEEWGVVLLLSSMIVLISFAPVFKVGDVRNDLSYGVYVFAFPVQQYLVHLWPAITPSLLCIGSLGIVLMLSYFSWIYIEKPAIELGKNLRGRIRSFDHVNGIDILK